MNKRLGHLLVLAAFVGLGNGLGGGPGGGTDGDGALGGGLGGRPGVGAGAGGVGGPSNGGASGSTSANSGSGLLDNGGNSAPKNTSLGFSSPRGGGGAGTRGSPGGAGEFDEDEFPGGAQGFVSAFGAGWGSDRRPEDTFPARGSGFGDGHSGDLGAWSAERNTYGDEGASGGGIHGFDGFNGGSEFGNPNSGFGFPAGIGAESGTDGTGSGGAAGGFSAPLPEAETGEFFGSQTGHGGSFPSSSGFLGSPTDESPIGLGSRNPGASNNPSSALAHVLGAVPRPRLLPRLWSSGRTGRGPFGLGHGRGKTDPRAAAAIALGALAGVAALSSIGAGIAAAVHSRRRSGASGLGARRTGCASGDCRRKRRSILESKVPVDILDHISMNFERL